MEISDELEVFGLSVSENAALDKLSNLASKWNIDGVSLVEKYVAFQRNANLPDQISVKHVEYFDREISAKMESSKSKVKSQPAPSPANNLLTKNMLRELIAIETKDEQTELLSSYSSVPLTLPKIASPFNKENHLKLSQVMVAADKKGPLAIYPEELKDYQYSSPRIGSLSTFRISSLDFVSSTFRYMYQNALEKSEILDDWTWRIAKGILDDLPMDKLLESDNAEITLVSQTSLSDSMSELPQDHTVSDLSDIKPTLPDRITFLRPVCSRLQSPSLVAGRITAQCTSSDIGVSTMVSANGDSSVIHSKYRLQITNACIIGLRRMERSGVGLTPLTQLDLGFSSELKSFSIYSGQPVVLRAVNPTGQSLGVMEIMPSSIPTPPSIDLSKSENLHVMVACGPYTLSDSHNPSPLLNLLNSVKLLRPDVLILIGPLVDCEHSQIESYIETTYQELFESRLNTVAEWCSHLSVRLVVVPSWREFHHQPVYPTPPIDKSWTQVTPELISWYDKVEFVTDPCIFRIGEYVFGVTSVDVLRHLSNEEVSANCTGDRISRLCKHLLASGSFYPVHPPADELPLDYPLWNQYGQLSTTPHFLIVPSRLRQFAKNVDGVMCVNPGFVSRGQALGSFAQIIIQPKTKALTKPDSSQLNGTDPCSDQSDVTSLTDRSVVIVHKIEEIM